MIKKYKFGILILILFFVIISVFFYFKNEKVYVFKEFNSTGQLIGTKEYVLRDGNAIIHGKFIDYNIKGIKISEGQFLNGHIYGKTSYYYDNGKIEEVHFRKDKETTLESTYYNRNGLIKEYFMFDDFGKTVFFIAFDGKAVKKYDGYSIWPLGQYRLVNKKQYKIKTGDVLKVGDVVVHDYLVVNMPNSKRTFKIETMGVDNSKVKRIISKKLPTRMVVEEIVTKKGLNRIKAIAQFTFNDKETPVLNDTVSFDVYVE